MNKQQQIEDVLRAVLAGFVADPGTPDLDDEQTIYVRITLGDWRRARRIMLLSENKA
jgi:hypothetical protein